jgi:predicted proteasome-type protease
MIRNIILLITAAALAVTLADRNTYAARCTVNTYEVLRVIADKGDRIVVDQATGALALENPHGRQRPLILEPTQ